MTTLNNASENYVVVVSEMCGNKPHHEIPVEPEANGSYEHSIVIS